MKDILKKREIVLERIEAAQDKLRAYEPNSDLLKLFTKARYGWDYSAEYSMRYTGKTVGTSMHAYASDLEKAVRSYERKQSRK